LQRALEHHPDSVDALISVVELNLERHRNAHVAVAGARRRSSLAGDDIEPDEAARLYWAARESFRHCERILKARLDRADCPENRLKCATLYIAMKEYDHAEEMLKSLVDMPVARYEVHSRLGVVYMGQERFGRAVLAFGEALNDDPDSIATRTNLAEAHRKRGDLDTAEREYRTVLNMAPGHVEAQLGLAELHIGQAEETSDSDTYEQAVSCFTRGLELAGSERGSKMMKRGKTVVRRRELADSLYSCGYARVKQYETSGHLPDPGLLRDALKDFRSCLTADASQHKAERAIEKLQQQVGRFRPQWIEEKLGPLVIVALTIATFALIQSSFFFQWPIKELDEAYYGVISLGVLLFVIAGLFLPRILRLKVGGIELEKTTVSQVSAPSSIGLSTPTSLGTGQ